MSTTEKSISKITQKYGRKSSEMKGTASEEQQYKMSRNEARGMLPHPLLEAILQMTTFPPISFSPSIATEVCLGVSQLRWKSIFQTLSQILLNRSKQIPCRQLLSQALKRGVYVSLLPFLLAGLSMQCALESCPSNQLRPQDGDCIEEQQSSRKEGPGSLTLGRHPP